jgi:BlaI family transcriptional regulator, penicillinase repressor
MLPCTKVVVTRGENPCARRGAVAEDVQFTERELDLMSILWKLGSGTVSEVREHLRDEPGYTSVLKMLQILEEKGHVRHESEGRAYRYFPTIGSEAAGRSALARIVDKIFHGSAELALARLVEERPITSEELDRMRRILDDLAEERAAGSGGGDS